MPTAKKLPSGSWRVRVYSYTDQDGKKHYKSFTAGTKREAERLALSSDNTGSTSITFKQAAEKYVTDRSAVLSPRSVTSYRTHINNHVQRLMNMRVDRITQADVQRAINEDAAHLSPKTIRDIHGFVSAVMGSVRPDFVLKTALPKKVRTKINVPPSEDVDKLINMIRGTDLYLPVLLAAFGPMRRGEVCALRMEDINGSIVHVCRNMVLAPDHSWITKVPKSYAGDRYIPYPDFVRDAWIQTGVKSGRIVTMTPNQLTNRFGRTIRQSGIEVFRFHDLRHYCASIQHALGIPDAYIMQRGGWGSDRTLKSVYRHALEDETTAADDRVNRFFSDRFGSKV